MNWRWLAPALTSGMMLFFARQSQGSEIVFELPPRVPVANGVTQFGDITFVEDIFTLPRSALLTHANERIILDLTGTDSTGELIDLTGSPNCVLNSTGTIVSIDQHVLRAGSSGLTTLNIRHSRYVGVQDSIPVRVDFGITLTTVAVSRSSITLIGRRSVADLQSTTSRIPSTRTS